ncbi:MAG: hypothetical protein H6Q25_848 [Bacteroidetes bacterium]|nr:hypothetical protein [Bacteroidota bacterium]
MKTTLKIVIILSFLYSNSSLNAQGIEDVYNRIYGKQIIKSELKPQNNTPKTKDSLSSPSMEQKAIKNSGLYRGSGSNLKYSTCNCDLSEIYSKISLYFNKWQEKGEFEKEEIYRERLKTESQNKFAKLCKDVIDSYIKVGYYDETSCSSSKKYSKFYTSSYIDYYSDDKHAITISEYDSENEYFPLILNLDETKILINLPVNISDAPQFKKNWTNSTISYYLFDFFQYEGFLLPKSLTINNSNRNYTINIPKEYLSPIRIYFDDLEIINPYLKGWYFEY